MNRPTDTELEQLLQDYGTISPAVSFTYRKPRATGRRTAALLLVALLTTLLLAITVAIASHEDSSSPVIPSTSPQILQSSALPTPTSPSVTTNGATVTTSPRPTATPTTPQIPPKTEAPVLQALLPAWYSGSSVQLVNILSVGSSTALSPTPLENGYSDYNSFELNLGKMTHTIYSGDLIEISGYPEGHQTTYCRGIYLRLSDSKVICLGHELRTLWETVGINASASIDLVRRYASADGEQFVLSISENGQSQGHFLYDRTTSRLQRIPYDLSNCDFVSYGERASLIVYATPNQADDLQNDLWLIDTATMECKQICDGYRTFGHSYFSADQRFIYTYLRLGDAVESNEYGQWAMYDTQTGLSFCGEGEICYLQNGILISRTPDEFRIYDCTTGEILVSRPDLPCVVHADQKDNRYTLTVYNPQTGLVEATLTNIGAYAISENQQYLFYYTDKALGVTVLDLAGGQSVSLPVSEAFLKETNPEAGDVIYSMMISDNGSKITLGYRISLEDYMERKQREITALRDSIHTSFLSVNNIPDFWKKFAPYAEQYAHLIEWTGYYIHENYAIYMIAYQNNGLSLTRSVGVLNIVEDYRDGSFTMYHGSESLYFLGNLVARSTWENKVQLFRRTLKGNYDATCALLPTLGEKREFYFDYAKCYDANGKWSADLKNAYIRGYEFLSKHTAKANVKYSPEGLDQTLRIVSEHPINTERIGDLTIRRVADIVLYAENGDQLLNARITISSEGRYYLQYVGNSWYYGTEITEAEYMSLLETQGSILAKWGVYTDKRLAFVPWDGYIDAAYDFLPRGNLPIPNPIVNSEEEELAAANALAMIREGGYSSEEIIKTLFYYDHAYEYIFLLAEYNVEHSWRYSFRHTAPILIEIKNGVITLSDPSATAQ